jgi:predicted metal-binding membrane protein
LTAAADAALLSVLKRDRLVVGAALALVTLAAWSYVLWLAAAMSAAAPAMPGMDMTMAGAMAPGFARWTLARAVLVFAMWAVMMIGMMMPSAAPMVLLYAQVARQAKTLGRTFAPAGWFASGYLLAWTCFAALATLAQAALEHAALLSPAMASANRWFGGAVLIAAGLYQLTPLKHACLTQCRAPLQFVQRHGGFRAGAWGSLRLGTLHGFYCIGCCWALMALLFVGGVMNLVWIAGIAIFVLGEKVLPGGAMFGRLAGMAAVAAGVWVMFG